ncbi:MAG: hypothetical protein HRU38_22720 [Saccharospirillaceae bacterium]|nr:hypothetical protein [Pseudomonadales bacterium]NRB81439.1 hypothetical protein [Saccharospirillaceae bacterium]
MIKLLTKYLKRIIYLCVFIFILLMAAVFYFSTPKTNLEKQTLDFKQTLKMSQYVNTIKQRSHLNGQTYFIEFSLNDLNSALTFLQTLKNPGSRSSIVFNGQNIDIKVEHIIDLKFSKRFFPVNTSIKLNNYNTPIQPSFIKGHKLPDFLIALTNNKLSQILIEQQLDQVINNTNIKLTIKENKLIIAYTWSDLFSEKFLQPDLIIEQKIELAYQTLQKNLKEKGERKVKLQDAMLELISYLNNFEAANEQIIFWSVLFASVDHNRANKYLNLNLQAPLVKLTLQNRYDLAKHFVFSAYLQQIGGNQFSYLIGEYKENKDATTRATKFSYSDVMANQSGILFSQVLSNKIKNFEQLTFINKISESKLTLEDELFEDGIDAPNKQDQDKQVMLINKELRELPIYQ